MIVKIRRWAAPLALLKMLSLPTRIAVVGVYGAQAVLPVAAVVAAGAVVSRVVAAAPGAPVPWQAAVTAVVTLCGLLMCQQVALLAAEPLQASAVRQIDRRFRREVAETALAPVGVGHLDDEETAGRFAIASTDLHGFTPGRAAVGQVAVTADVAAALGSVAVVATISPWTAVTVTILLLVRRAVGVRLTAGLTRLWVDSPGLATRWNYWRGVAGSAREAKEIRVFGLAEWVVEHWRTSLLAQFGPIRAARTRVVSYAWLPLLAGMSALFLGLVGILWWAGPIDAGALARGVTALMAALTIGTATGPAYDVAYGRPLMETAEVLRASLAVQSRTAPEPDTPPAGVPSDRDAADDGTAVPRRPAPPTIRFEDVRFGYPGLATPVLDGFSLDIRPGEVLALVGANGAGKTTMTKLLARLYELDGGMITVDGTALTDLSPRWWRRQLAVVTQGFVHYDLTLRQNVAVGAAERLGDAEFFRRVAGDLDLDDLVRKLPAGWDTPLSRARTGGADLSGGQWQRVALARAVFALRAGRRVLVLDEPTAHLDAEAEFATFKKLIAAARGVSVILISHRLSTVRLADRIAVIRDGRLHECGTHEELVAGGVDYAEMFEVQARQFRDDPLVKHAR